MVTTVFISGIILILRSILNLLPTMGTFPPGILSFFDLIQSLRGIINKFVDLNVLGQVMAIWLVYNAAVIYWSFTMRAVAFQKLVRPF
jgi:hypothetical protein